MKRPRMERSGPRGLSSTGCGPPLPRFFSARLRIPLLLPRLPSDLETRSCVAPCARTAGGPPAKLSARAPVSSARQPNPGPGAPGWHARRALFAFFFRRQSGRAPIIGGGSPSFARVRLSARLRCPIRTRFPSPRPARLPGARRSHTPRAPSPALRRRSLQPRRPPPSSPAPSRRATAGAAHLDCSRRPPSPESCAYYRHRGLLLPR